MIGWPRFRAGFTGAHPWVHRRRDSNSTSLPADEDPDALTFEINGMILAANANFVLRQDAGTLEMAKAIVRRRLGLRERSANPHDDDRGVRHRGDMDDKPFSSSAAVYDLLYEAAGKDYDRGRSRPNI